MCIDFAGWQFDLAFNPTILEAIEVNEGDFLENRRREQPSFRKGLSITRQARLPNSARHDSAKTGSPAQEHCCQSLSLQKHPDRRSSHSKTFNSPQLQGEPIPVGLPEILITIEGQLTTGDVNRDGQVSILDMVLVARQFGNTVPSDSAVDINGDGVVNVLDLILVSQNMGKSNDAAAPSLAVINARELDPAIVRTWIAQAELEHDGSIAFQQGLAKLRELLSSLLPKETATPSELSEPI